VLLLAQWCQL